MDELDVSVLYTNQLNFEQATPDMILKILISVFGYEVICEGVERAHREVQEYNATIREQSRSFLEGDNG